MFKGLDYFNIGFRSASTAQEIAFTKNKQGYKPNSHLIKDSLDLIKDLQIPFLPYEEIIPKIEKWKTSYQLLFPKTMQGHFWEAKRKQKEFNNIYPLMKKLIFNSKKTLEKMSRGRIPSQNQLEQVRELFAYLSEECLSNTHWENSKINHLDNFVLA